MEIHNKDSFNVVTHTSITSENVNNTSKMKSEEPASLKMKEHEKIWNESMMKHEAVSLKRGYRAEVA